jgi:hypothetical protein
MQRPNRPALIMQPDCVHSCLVAALPTSHPIHLLAARPKKSHHKTRWGLVLVQHRAPQHQRTPETFVPAGPLSWHSSNCVQLSPCSLFSLPILYVHFFSSPPLSLPTSTGPTSGTSQDSPLFYARLFGLLTPQASLAAISLILAATRIPADLARTQPTVTYARLASMEVEVVGRLTGARWLYT